MKKIRSFTSIIIAFIFLLAVSSCKKKADDATPAAETGTFEIHLHTNADTNELDAYNDTVVLTGGRQISVSLSQLYISGIQLIKSDGSLVDAPSVSILQKLGVEEYIIGSVPSGNYKSIKFNVGLSSSVNSTTPAATDTNLYRPEMWYGSSVSPDGFIFVNLQGSIDTATVPSASNQLIPFAYKIGTNAHLVSVTMPDENYTVAPGQLGVVHLVSDYAKLFSGIQLNVPSNLQVNTAADNNGALASQLAINIRSMFSYEY